MKVYIFGPGIGESIVLCLPTGEWGVIDCYQPKAPGASGTLKFLADNKVDRLLFFCQTHPHDDHFFGAAKLLTHFRGKIEHLWTSPGLSASRKGIWTKCRVLDWEAKKLAGLHVGEPDELAAFVAELKIAKASMPQDRYVKPFRNTKLISGKDFEIEALGPTTDILDQFAEKCAQRIILSAPFSDDESGSYINNLSVVLQITIKRRRYIFLADAQGRDYELFTHDPSLRLIKIAHHGSENGAAANVITGCTKRRFRKCIGTTTPFRSSKLPRSTMLRQYQDALQEFKLTPTPRRIRIVPGMVNLAGRIKSQWLEV